MTEPEQSTTTGRDADAAAVSSPAAALRTVWLDADPPSTAWPRPKRLSRSTRRLLIAVPVLGLILLVGVVWAFGGFAPRENNFIDVPPGQVFENGPLALTFDRAEAYQEIGYDDAPEGWVVEVTGTARNIGEESTDLDSALACAEPERGSENIDIDVELPHLVQGDSDIQPGMAPVPFRMKCALPVEWKPGTEILAGSRRQEYGSLDPLRISGEEGWRDSPGFYRVHLPYEVGPPRLP